MASDIITRDIIAQVFPTQRSRRAFELMQSRLDSTEEAAALTVAATDKLNEAAFVTLSPNAELPNERTLQFGFGIKGVATSDTLTISASDDLAKVQGGFRVNITALGDTSVVIPISGRLATQEWVNAQGFGGGGGGGTGTVTSVALSMPAIFTVTGSPVTTAGTLTASLASQTANLVFAAPNGAPGAPTFRALVAADIPTLNQNTTGSAAKLTTARTLGMTGDVVWTSPSFDGSGNVTAAAAIQAGVVTLAMQANMATASVVYRKTAGAGAPEVQTLATLKTDLGLMGTNSGDQTITLTGDVTGSGTGSFPAALAVVNGNVGSFGSSSVVPVITVNAKGLITAVSTASVGALNGLATATVPTAQLEWSETLAALGVTGSSRIFLTLAPTADSDENEIETLNIAAMAAAPGTDVITVTLAFGEPTSGPIKLNWSAI